MENNNNQSISNWLPRVIFILGSVSLIAGIGCAFFFGMYTHGGEAAAWISFIGGAALGALLWGMSFIVKAAMIYIDKHK